MWEKYGKVRYYLHRWPSQRSMKRARARIKALSGRSQVGQQLKDVIGRLNLFLRGWGNFFRTGNAATKFGFARPLRGMAAQALAHQEARPQPSCRTVGTLDPHLVPTTRACTSSWHHPIPERLRNHVQKTVGKPCAGKSHARIERGMGTGFRCAGTAPLTTNGQAVRTSLTATASGQAWNASSWPIAEAPRSGSCTAGGGKERPTCCRLG